MLRLFLGLFLLFGLVNQFAQASIRVDGRAVSSLSMAFKLAKEKSLIQIDAGSFKQAGILKADNVTIRGVPGKTVIHSATVQGKAALVIQGDNTVIENIECHSISVPHKNGACIRFEGKGLELNNVYFHDAQQGMLTGHNPGRVVIKNSKFERLGFDRGQSHGIYVGGGELNISRSQFLSSKNEGMEIKSRAERTVIQSSTIASLNGVDSRLLDIPNGGVLIVKDSILQQGNKTSNSDVIGFGLEGYKHKNNRIQLIGNIILLERSKGNRLLHIKRKMVKPRVEGNVIVGKANEAKYEDNFHYSSRKAAGLPPEPKLPKIE